VPLGDRPRGETPRVSLTLFLSRAYFIVYIFWRIVVAGIQSAYAMSLGTSRSPEASAVTMLVL